MAGFLQAAGLLGSLLGFEPAPGTPKHREALFRSMKERNDELARPPGQRDEARLAELTKRVLRLRTEATQARVQELRRYADMVLQQPDLGCCRDCVRVALRVVASLRANAAWQEEWVQISTLRLQALEQGQPYPPLTLPYLDVRPHLAKGVPEDLPPSIDRCAACQEELDKHLYLERYLLVEVDVDP